MQLPSFFNSIGFKIVRPFVLLVLLATMSLALLSFLFILHEMRAYMSLALEQFGRSQQRILAEEFLHNNHTHQEILTTVRQAVNSGNDLEAIALHALTGNTALKDISIFDSTTQQIIVGTMPYYAAGGLRFNEKNGFLASYTVATTLSELGLTVNSTYSVTAILQSLAKTHLQSIIPFTVRITVFNPDTNRSIYLNIHSAEISPIQYSTESYQSLLSTIDPDSPVEVLYSDRMQRAYAMPEYNTVLQVYFPMSFITIPPTNLLVLMVFAALFLTGISFMISIALSKSLIKPLLRIRDKLIEYQPQGTPYYADASTKDEIQQLDYEIEDVTKKLTSVYTDLESQVHEKSLSFDQVVSKDNALFDSINVGLLIIDSAGVIIEYNAALQKLLYTMPLEVHQTLATSVLTLCKKEVVVEKQDHPVERVLREHSELLLQPDEHYALCVDEKLIPIRMVITPIVLQGTFNGAAIIIQDATHEYKIERLKNDFIELASHQLRTPLASIQWYSELLSQDEATNFTNEQRQFIVELRLATQRLGSVINELMDASRLHDGYIASRPEQFDINKLIKGIINDLTQNAERKGITITLFGGDKELFLLSDPILLGIAFQNLLFNAVKYSLNNSEVCVRIDTTLTEIKIHVIDEGIGIPQADQDHIFHKLFRAKNARTVATDGSGLGLYSSRKILKQLGGKITFSSAENKGSTFTMIIPRQ